MNDTKLTPTEFFATLLFHRPGSTARELKDAYLRYQDKEPQQKVVKKVYSWETEKYRKTLVRKYASQYNSYFYASHKPAWKGHYGTVWSNGRQLGRLWRSKLQDGVQHFFLLPLGYRKIAVTSDGRPIDLTLYLSKQLSFSFEPRKCA